MPVVNNPGTVLPSAKIVLSPRPKPINGLDPVTALPVKADQIGGLTGK